MKFVNLTPHDIVVRTPAGVDVVFPASGTVARVRTIETPAGEIGSIPLVEVEMAEIENLPDPEEGTVYIVSSMALDPSREDVVAPDTGPTAIRDENGHIVAVTRFKR